MSLPGLITNINGAEDFVGEGEAAKRVRAFIQSAAFRDSTVIITGESGTGKELVAKAIHFTGKRKSRKIIFVRCFAQPESLLEKELFGCEIMTCSDPKKDGKGVLEKNEGGTLVIDGIGEAGTSFQETIIKVLENRKVCRIGGRRETPFDVALIITAKGNLNKLIHEGNLRGDFYNSFNGLSVEIPPLRERKEDIPLLAEHFLRRCHIEFGKKAMGISKEALEILESYDWPGNAWELKGFLTKLFLLENTDIIMPEHILSRRFGIFP